MQSKAITKWLHRGFTTKVLVIGSLLAIIALLAFVQTASADQHPGSSEAPPPADEARAYKWTGIVVAEAARQHLGLKRECDGWLLRPQSDENARKLKGNVGNKVAVLGNVVRVPRANIRHIINVKAVFGPDDSMPQTEVAVQEYPCPKEPRPPRPKPGGMSLDKEGDMAARGFLVWEDGKAFLATPNGEIKLVLPVIEKTSTGDEEKGRRHPDVDKGLDVVALGPMRHGPQSLTVAARTVRGFPVAIVTKNRCTGRVDKTRLAKGEMAARGHIVRDGERVYLKTASGPILLSRAKSGADYSRANLKRLEAEVVVFGQWKSGEKVLHMAVRKVSSLGQRPCHPNPTPFILPGEIAAVGTLMWENGVVKLVTPSGDIILTNPAGTELARIHRRTPMDGVRKAEGGVRELQGK